MELHHRVPFGGCTDGSVDAEGGEWIGWRVSEERGRDLMGRVTLGVDPGQSGGLAVVGVDQVIIDARRMPLLSVGGKKAVDAHELSRWLGLHAVDQAVLEAVHAMPRQGVSSSFQFGRMFGAVEAVVGSLGVPIHYVSPSRWKGALRLSSDKRASLDAFRLRFGADAAAMYTPKLADEGVAEAALLAAYQQERGGA